MCKPEKKQNGEERQTKEYPRKKFNDLERGGVYQECVIHCKSSVIHFQRRCIVPHMCLAGALAFACPLVELKRAQVTCAVALSDGSMLLPHGTAQVVALALDGMAGCLLTGPKRA